MNNQLNEVGIRRRNSARSKSGAAATGTEIKKGKSLSYMSYLGNSNEVFTTEKTSEKTEKRNEIGRGNKKNTREKVSEKEVEQRQQKKSPAKNKTEKKVRPTGKSKVEERKQLRRDMIEKATEYLSAEEVVSEKRKKAKKSESRKNNEPQTVNSVKEKKNKSKKCVKVRFLGGVGEIGKNMTAFEYGNDIIVVDAGLSFPDYEMPGVDLVVPDVSYLVNNKDKIKGIFLTHGHEDHIGGLPYLLKQIDPKTPVYGTKLTLALADNKVREHRIQNTSFRTQKSGDKVKVGCFEVEFVNVNHSISGAVAFSITTPCGVIYHSGDFKIDLTPVAGNPIDLNKITEIGKEGVLLYMGESTNIERPGYTMSETVVGTTFDHIFAENSSRRMIIATFASNVHRLKQIIDVAVKYRRKVALSGRSMLNVVEAASKIGELTIPEGVLVDIEKIKNYFDNEIVIISTGTQGEPMSALTRMANGEFNKVTIGANDTVVISATPIPGNEKMIYKVINNLYKSGANVVYESLEKIHVSGHACQEEHKIMHKLLAPKFFIPVHGEYRHLKRHALLAQEMGLSENNIIIPEVGNCVELTDSSLKLGNNFPAGVVIIDGSGSEDFSTSEVMKDRRLISNEGMLIVALTLSDGVAVGEPIIKNKGVMFPDTRDYENEILTVVKNIIDRTDFSSDKNILVKSVEKGLRDFLFKKLKQSPMVVPIIMEV